MVYTPLAEDKEYWHQKLHSSRLEANEGFVVNNMCHQKVMPGKKFKKDELLED
ncbi:hypothetical protein T11_18372 [Trichinella zimbabwensis]|uniref:Uncharacterized protein n=1 Tax=Trichinella zimbabwensis TaxID=268475 RepID=A0A0V1GL44_9BILA|nr:hypothetical protein T11_211 [Trichinella zimbabwensis]KRY98894.1 hypothetical protein T11_18372 [Trichinella zimbabwensis]